MTPQLIIFDFDGTMADTAATILSTYQATFSELGIPPHTEDECRATIGLPLRDGFRQLYPDYTEEQLDNCVAAYRRLFTANKAKWTPELFPGVRETLEELQKLGIRMTIASSRSHESLVEFCDLKGISEFFSIILGAEDVVRAKPDPEPVLNTLAALGIDADMAIVVGDMPVDIAMGRGAQCRTVGVSYGNSSRRELVNSGASFIIDAFPELIPRVIFER